jgi:hypothetical protein
MKMMIQEPIRFRRYVRYDTIRCGENPLQLRRLQGLPFRYGRYGNPIDRGDVSPLYGSYRIVSSLGIRFSIRFRGFGNSCACSSPVSPTPGRGLTSSAGSLPARPFRSGVSVRRCFGHAGLGLVDLVGHIQRPQLFSGLEIGTKSQ